MIGEITVAFDAATQQRVLNFKEPVGQLARIRLEDLTERGIEDPLLSALKLRLPEGAWVAGGCFESLIRGEKPKDYDIFFRDAEAFFKTLQLLTARPEDIDEHPEIEPATGYGVSNVLPDEMVTQSCRFVDLERAQKPGPKIQLIKTMWYPSLLHVLQSFDFTAAQIGMDSSGILLNPVAPLDIARKRLVLNRMTFPASTLRRMIKYTQKGYYACPGALQQIALATAETLRAAPESNGPVYVD